MDLQELEKLARLKDKGIITEEQFNQKKQEILDINNNHSREVGITKKYKRDNIKQSKKIIFYTTSILSFLSLWIAMFCAIGVVIDSLDFVTSFIILATPISLFSLLMFISRRTYKKILDNGDCENFIRKISIYNIVMVIITIVIIIGYSLMVYFHWY